MQAVLLAAGQSSRMYPFTETMHKCMVSLLGKPLIVHTIERLQKKGITDIIIVVDDKETIKSVIGDGSQFGVTIQYVIQSNPNGMGDAVLLAKEHIVGDFLLMNAYHADVDLFIDSLRAEKEQGSDAVLLVKQRENVSDFGVVTVDGSKVLDLVEKPSKEEAPSNLCVIGLYIFGKEFLPVLADTPSEHYQLETAIAAFAQKNTMTCVETQEETLSLKYPWDLLTVKDFLMQSVVAHRGEHIAVADSAEIIGDVYIGDNVTIMEGVRIKGPCYIGDNVVVGNHAVLRNNAVIEADCVVGAFMEVKNSIVMKGTTTHSGFIGDSVVGEQARIAAQFCSANVRLDKENVIATVKEKPVNTGRKSLGTMIGHNTKIGIKCSTMPGIIIGNNVTIGPSTVVLHNVASNVTYYTKFQEIIEKK